MSQLLLDGNNDIVLDGNGQLALTGDTLSTVEQRIKCRLRTFRGELFIDRDIGVPYFDVFQDKAPNTDSVANLLRSVIYDVEGVKSVELMDVVFDRENRVFHVSVSVTADDGSRVDINL